VHSRGVFLQLRQRLATWMPHVVVVYTVLHILQGCVGALPDLRMAKDRKQWNDPRAVAELTRWADVLGTDVHTLSDGLYAASQLSVKVLAVVQAPFQPLFAINHNMQRWSMFPGAMDISDTYEVRVRMQADAPWQPFFSTQHVTSDAAFADRMAFLDHTRLHSAQFAASWKVDATMRKKMCNAIAQRLFASSTAQEVECSFVRTHIPTARLPPRTATAPAPAPQRDRAVRVMRGQAPVVVAPDAASLQDAP
jgi:hypothetical protein